MTEFVLEETRLREAAAIAKRIARHDTVIDLTPAVELGQSLAALVGKSVDTFRALDENVRNKLKEAVLFVNQKLSSDHQIFGFLRNVCGNLKKCAKGTVDSDNFAKIALFLTALVSTDEAIALQVSMIIY